MQNAKHAMQSEKPEVRFILRFALPVLHFALSLFRGPFLK
jgi:hypothetical protein